MTYGEFVPHWAYICEAFAVRRDDPRIRIYHEELRHLSHGDWEIVSRKAVRTKQRFPTIQELLSMAPTGDVSTADDEREFVSDDCSVIGCIDGLIWVETLRVSMRCPRCNRFQSRQIPVYDEIRYDELTFRTKEEMDRRLKERIDLVSGAPRSPKAMPALASSFRRLEDHEVPF